MGPRGEPRGQESRVRNIQFRRRHRSRITISSRRTFGHANITNLQQVTIPAVTAESIHIGMRDCFSGRSGRRDVCTGRSLRRCKQTPRGFCPSILRTASSLLWNRTRYCVGNSCRTPSEQLRARVSTRDSILASRILTINRKCAEGGEWCQDTPGHREGIVRCVPSSQVCSGLYQRTRQTL